MTSRQATSFQNFPSENFQHQLRSTLNSLYFHSKGDNLRHVEIFIWFDNNDHENILNETIYAWAGIQKYKLYFLLPLSLCMKTAC